MKLLELAKVIRSKNAGPFWITLDIMFGSKDIYEKVKATGILNRELISKLYNVDIDRVKFFTYDPAFAFKASIKRKTGSGGIGDNDIWGAQQHAPLLYLNIPEI